MYNCQRHSNNNRQKRKTKQKHPQEVTVSELCDYLGLKKEDILQFIR